VHDLFGLAHHAADGEVARAAGELSRHGIHERSPRLVPAANGETDLGRRRYAMARGVITRLGLAVSVAAVVASLTAGAVLGGEVTGNGKKNHYSQGRSICRFSGQNDNPNSTDPANPPGRVQSYGYSFVRNGQKDDVPSPGYACNPNNGFE
jgi:hypothetical protein